METPSSIGPYKILTPIARGGMGEVWRARHPTLERDVAVKVIRADLHEKPDMRELFRREVKVLSRLRAPQTVQVIDAGFTDAGHPYIVTEFLEGLDLQAHLKANGAMPVPAALDVAIQVLESLAEAHAMGLIHRDIKPANVFLQHVPGGGQAVKVLDFGVAKILGGDENDAGETLAGGAALKGSPRYMAPEQIRGLGLSAQTDLYGVGGLLYHMIAGEPVFNTHGREALLMAHLQTAPMPLSERCPLFDVPPTVDALVLQCLRKNPTERPWGARELIASLQRALAGAEAPPPALELGALPAAAPAEPEVAFTFESLVGGGSGGSSSSGARSRAPTGGSPLFGEMPVASTGGSAPGFGDDVQRGLALDDTHGAEPSPLPAPPLRPMLDAGFDVGAPPAESPPEAGGPGTPPGPPEAEAEVLELADVPGRERLRRAAAGGVRGPQTGPVAPAFSTPPPRIGAGDEPDLQLAREPRAVAEGQRRLHEGKADRVRREAAAQQGSAMARTLLGVLLLVGAALGGLFAWRQFRTPDAPTTPVSSAQTTPRPLPTFVSAGTDEDRPAVARRAGETMPGVRPDAVTLGVSDGTANFLRMDTKQTLCTDAVECPMPLGVPLRVQRANGKGTTLPPVTADQAAAGVITVKLDR